MLVVANWALSLTPVVCCQIGVVSALRANICVSTQTAVFGAHRAVSAKVARAVVVISIRALCLAGAVWSQVHRVTALQANIPTTTLGTGAVALLANTTCIICTVVEKTVWANGHTAAVNQMQRVVTLRAQSCRLALVAILLTGGAGAACLLRAKLEKIVWATQFAGPPRGEVTVVGTFGAVILADAGAAVSLALLACVPGVRVPRLVVGDRTVQFAPTVWS
mmetsp:Transcript_20366/g.47505  ORF Transcript_20366/g.47505 Transcript_20366/m.47505 type:complete len:221 (-) Transcript_20366:615-1277(-)